MNVIQTIAVAILPLIFAITVHEAAHGWVANKLGDPTAKGMGRLTFNPIPHIDPVGTILVPMVMLVMGGFLFGWAKPVPVNMRNFKHPRKDMAIVAVAGPLSNFSMAILWGLIWKMTLMMPAAWEQIAIPILLTAKFGIFLNLILMVLNLLPLPPLDGGRVLTWLVPEPFAQKLDQLERYGIIILIGLLFFGLWEKVIHPVMGVISNLIQQLLGIQL